MKIKFKVPSIACSVCGETITNGIKTKLPTAKVEVDVETKTVTVSGKACRSPWAPPLRTERDCLQSSGSSLTSSLAWNFLNVPAYDTLYVGVEGCRFHLNLLFFSQVLCDGFRFPHR